MTLYVKSKIEKVLPHCFAFVFDGWSTGSMHYAALFATYPSDSALGYDKVLLKITSMEYETSQSAREHLEFLDFVLDVYDRELSNVATLTGESTVTSRALSRMVGPHFVGCHIHRFSLRVNLWGLSDVHIILQ